MKSCNEEIDQESFLEVDIQYSEQWHELNNNLPFLPERVKIEKIEKLVIYLLNKKNIKTSFKSWISFDKVHRVIKFNQKAWLKLQIDMESELRKKVKRDF